MGLVKSIEEHLSKIFVEINKLNNKEYGFYGEAIAKKYLKKNKYKIIAINYTQKNGEADIIAIETKKSRKIRKEDYAKMSDEIRKEDVLVFVEVKSRNSLMFGVPSMAVNNKKQNKYLSIARNFMMVNPKFQGMQYRFDIIEVHEKDVMNHIINAF